MGAMASHLADAFERLGANVLRVDDAFIRARKGDEAVFGAVRDFGPDFFVGMNLTGLAKISGAWTPEYLKVPCLSWMVDHPAFFLKEESPLYQLRDCAHYHMACVDPLHLKLLERFYPKERLLFLPHATAELAQETIPYADRLPAIAMTAGHGTLMAGSSVQTEPESADQPGSWFRRAYRLIHNSVLADNGLDIFDQIESMLRLEETAPLAARAYAVGALVEIEGRLRQEIRRSLVLRLVEETGLPVDIFGDESWKAVETGKVRYRGVLKYDDVGATLSRYRYVLNPQPPQTRNGSHERVMDALSAGTIPITLTNKFYRDEFGEDIVHVMCTPDEFWINLASDANYAERLERARDVVSERHTWSVRAGGLIERFCR